MPQIGWFKPRKKKILHFGGWKSKIKVLFFLVAEADPASLNSHGSLPCMYTEPRKVHRHLFLFLREYHFHQRLHCTSVTSPKALLSNMSTLRFAMRIQKEHDSVLIRPYLCSHLQRELLTLKRPSLTWETGDRDQTTSLCNCYYLKSKWRGKWEMMRNPLPQLVGKMFARVGQTLTRVWIPELGAKQTTDLQRTCHQQSIWLVFIFHSLKLGKIFCWER